MARVPKLGLGADPWLKHPLNELAYHLQRLVIRDEFVTGVDVTRAALSKLGKLILDTGAQALKNHARDRKWVPGVYEVYERW